MLTNLRLRLLSYLVIIYMLIAFAWWSVLLFQKNRDAFNAKAELLRIGMVAEKIYQNEAQFKATEPYQTLKKEYRKQELMIFGEASVFILSLVIGIYLINRGYNKEIEIANQRRNFLLSITHELKSPIASIRLVLETFLKRKLKPEQTEKLGKNAIKDSERLNELVNNLLLAAKLEAEYQPQLEAIQIDELARDITNGMIEKFGNVHFEKNIQSPVSEFQGDQMGIVSVLTNLIENAVKYNVSNEPFIKISLNENPEGFHLEVADNGIGISEKEKKKIFQRFYRVGNEDTRSTKGTGLGLYIVNEIVKGHQGKIQVKDNIPTGTIFQIFFPKK